MKKYILTIIGIFSVGLLTAQIQTKLKVLDKESHEPLPYVKVLEKGKLLGETDESGLVVLRLSKPVMVELQLDNYDSKRIKLNPGKEVVVNMQRKTFQLDEVVLVSDPLRNPVHSVTVSDLEKKYSQPRNTAELFKDIPGITIQKRSAMSMEPSLRAFKYEEMNLIYDGGFKMVNACPNRMDPAPAHVIPEEVEKIELIKGPFDVRFGQTFGAVVNMVTGRPQPGDYGWKGTMQAGYEINGNNKVGLASLQYAREKFDLNGNFSYRDFGDYLDGKGDTVPASFRSKEYSIKMGWNPAKNQRLLIDWRQNFTRNVKHAGLPMDSPKDDSYLLGLDYYIKDLPGKFRAWKVKAYYSYVDHLMTNGYLMDVPRPNYPAFDARTPVWSRTLGGKVETEHHPVKDVLIYWGSSVDVIARNGTKTVVVNINPNTGVPLDPPMIKKLKVWQDAQINDFGFYGQLAWQRTKETVIKAGLRADYVWAMAKDPDPEMIQIYGDLGAQTDLVLSGNISYQLNRPDDQIQVALGRGSRTPSMIERYIHRFIISKDSRSYIGNPLLKPEVNNQVELSYARRVENWRFGVDVYASYFENYITARLAPELTSSQGSCGMPPQVPRQYINADAYQYGADLYASYRLNENWKVRADYNYIYAYNLTFNEPLALVNPSGAHLKVKYETPKFWADWRTEWRAAKKDVSVIFGENPTPAYWVHDLMLGYKPSVNWTIGLSVSNIFDAAYYNHTNFVFRNAGPRTGQVIYEPGRNISFMLTYKFHETRK